MNAKEKARELFNKMYQSEDILFSKTMDNYQAKQCALIAVAEILRIEIHHMHNLWVKYWMEVKQEIEKL